MKVTLIVVVCDPKNVGVHTVRGDSPFLNFKNSDASACACPPSSYSLLLSSSFSSIFGSQVRGDSDYSAFDCFSEADFVVRCCVWPGCSCWECAGVCVRCSRPGSGVCVFCRSCVVNVATPCVSGSGVGCASGVRYFCRCSMYRCDCVNSPQVGDAGDRFGLYCDYDIYVASSGLSRGCANFVNFGLYYGVCSVSAVGCDLLSHSVPVADSLDTLAGSRGVSVVDSLDTLAGTPLVQALSNDPVADSSDTLAGLGGASVADSLDTLAGASLVQVLFPSCYDSVADSSDTLAGLDGVLVADSLDTLASASLVQASSHLYDVQCLPPLKKMTTMFDVVMMCRVSRAIAESPKLDFTLLIILARVAR